MAEQKNIAIIGAGIFGLSLANALRDKNHNVTVFDRSSYDKNGYAPEDKDVQAASVDHNKIFRASYGSKIHYQRLAMEGREGWTSEDEKRGCNNNTTESNEKRLFVDSGMLRVQSFDTLDPLEEQTMANMERDGFRDEQFVRSNAADRERALDRGWISKLLDFEIPGQSESFYEAVLDSTAGFIRCSKACAYYQEVAVGKGVKFFFGSESGAVESLVKEDSGISMGRNKVTGLKTKDGIVHHADVVVVAAGSSSTQILPDLSYHLESSAGSIAIFKIDPSDTHLWEKYSPEKFPVLTWHGSGKDGGSTYVLPRTPEGLVKIGFRGIKFTNFESAPDGTPFTQDGKWSVPLPVEDCYKLPERSVRSIKQFVSTFLPEFDGVPFYSTKLCWYTDSLDNSFVIDYVPDYAEQSAFVCTGGSGHGAKFLPVLGKHAADILEHGDQSSSYMRPFWRWRPDIPRGNGLEEGPGGSRNIGSA